jgi:hypothetical protein
VHESISLPFVHPKFEVEIPTDGNKPPCKNPHSVMTCLSELPGPEDINRMEGTAQNNSFVIHPAKKTRPIGREATKQSDAVKYVINKVVEKTNQLLLRQIPFHLQFGKLSRNC